jgi:hypothetical protein
MRHARAHPPPLPRMPRLLARLLRRCPCRHDRAPLRRSVDVDQWGWILGFYPGTEVGEYRDGTAETFDLARADFDAAWKALLPTLTEAHFLRRRDARDWTAKKYAMWERGELLPSQKLNSWMGCPRGERSDSHDPAGSYALRRQIYAAQATDGIRR